MVTRRIIVKSQCETMEAKLVDLSPSGIGVLSDRTFHHQQNYTLLFSLPGYDGDNTVTIEAKPIHSTHIHQGHLVGFEFIQPSAHAQLVIREFYNYHRRFQA